MKLLLTSQRESGVWNEHFVVQGLLLGVTCVDRGDVASRSSNDIFFSALSTDHSNDHTQHKRIVFLCCQLPFLTCEWTPAFHGMEQVPQCIAGKYWQCVVTEITYPMSRACVRARVYVDDLSPQPSYMMYLLRWSSQKYGQIACFGCKLSSLVLQMCDAVIYWDFWDNDLSNHINGGYGGYDVVTVIAGRGLLIYCGVSFH